MHYTPLCNDHWPPWAFPVALKLYEDKKCMHILSICLLFIFFGQNNPELIIEPNCSNLLKYVCAKIHTLQSLMVSRRQLLIIFRSHCRGMNKQVLFVNGAAKELRTSTMEKIGVKAPGNYSRPFWTYNCSICLWEKPTLLISMISGF